MFTVICLGGRRATLPAPIASHQALITRWRGPRLSVRQPIRVKRYPVKRCANTTAAWRTVICAAAAAALLTGCSPVASRAGGPASPALSAAQGAYRLIQEPEDGYSAVIAIIAKARRTLRMTMYELADSAVVSALIDAHRRGVQLETGASTLNCAGRSTKTSAVNSSAKSPPPTEQPTSPLAGGSPTIRA